MHNDRRLLKQLEDLNRNIAKSNRRTPLTVKIAGLFVGAAVATGGIKTWEDANDSNGITHPEGISGAFVRHTLQSPFTLYDIFRGEAVHHNPELEPAIIKNEKAMEEGTKFTIERIIDRAYREDSTLDAPDAPESDDPADQAPSPEPN